MSLVVRTATKWLAPMFRDDVWRVAVVCADPRRGSITCPDPVLWFEYWYRVSASSYGVTIAGGPPTRSTVVMQAFIPSKTWRDLGREAKMRRVTANLQVSKHFPSQPASGVTKNGVQVQPVMSR